MTISSGPANQKTADFIERHREEDVRQLALKSCSDKDVDIPFALQQIAGWQVARQRIPSWAETSGLLYPPHLNLEQCSSETTARYKADLAARFGGDEMVDFTGGFGVDFAFMARHFKKATYVERNEDLCRIARHNFPLLGVGHATVVCDDAQNLLPSMEHVSLIYLDPARRDIKGRRTYAISDCQPDVTAIADVLLSKADNVMVKLSPMLDWHAVAIQLPQVQEIHIVSVRGECKEIIAIMKSGVQQPLKVYCVDDNSLFSFSTDESAEQMIATQVNVGDMLFEPNSSVMKSGEWGLLCRKFGVKAVATNSHLFVSENTRDDIVFPGRCFSIVAKSTMNRKELALFMRGVSRANIATRNFPMSVAELRKRLKVADGGDNYLFATTSESGEHLLIMCKKLG